MPFNSRRWQANTIVARVRASTAIGAANLDAAARAAGKLEVLRLAEDVSAGRISNDEAVAAFTQLVDNVSANPSETPSE